MAALLTQDDHGCPNAMVRGLCRCSIDTVLCHRTLVSNCCSCCLDGSMGCLKYVEVAAVIVVFASGSVARNLGIYAHYTIHTKVSIVVSIIAPLSNFN